MTSEDAVFGFNGEKLSFKNEKATEWFTENLDVQKPVLSKIDKMGDDDAPGSNEQLLNEKDQVSLLQILEESQQAGQHLSF